MSIVNPYHHVSYIPCQCVSGSHYSTRKFAVRGNNPAPELSPNSVRVTVWWMSESLVESLHQIKPERNMTYGRRIRDSPRSRGFTERLLLIDVGKGQPVAKLSARYLERQ